jgi:O-antigen/teichoic acid export membrane protein
MAQLLLLASGGIVVVVLVANRAFVDNWVGASRFGGMPLTVAFVASMLARQVNFTAVYTLFCFGHERRLALTTVADGVVGLVCMAVLVPMFGPIGAALGLLVATLTVSLPANLRALGRELGMPATAVLAFWGPWVVRFAVVLACAAAMAASFDIGGWFALCGATAGIGVLYALMMVPEIGRAPLGPMLAERLASWTNRTPGVLRPVAGSQAK